MHRYPSSPKAVPSPEIFFQIYLTCEYTGRNALDLTGILTLLDKHSAHCTLDIYLLSWANKYFIHGTFRKIYILASAVCQKISFFKFVILKHYPKPVLILTAKKLLDLLLGWPKIWSQKCEVWTNRNKMKLLGISICRTNTSR